MDFRKIILFIFLSCYLTVGYCQIVDQNFSISCLGSGKNQSQLVKVFTFGTNIKKVTIKAKRQSVYSVIFSGVKGQSCISQGLCSMEILETKESFFKTFFSSGKFLEFVQIAGDGSISSKDRLKIGRKTQIGIRLVVDRTKLQEYLISNKIIKKLGDGF
jgi:hypothetical protein